MAKYYGKIGFSKAVETAPHSGIWENSIVERTYRGDIVQDNRRWENGVSINSNIDISNKISIIADSYANANLQNMRYVTFKGTLWNIKDISISYPRLILTVGGVYNGEQASSSTGT